MYHAFISYRPLPAPSVSLSYAETFGNNIAKYVRKKLLYEYSAKMYRMVFTEKRVYILLALCFIFATNFANCNYLFEFFGSASLGCVPFGNPDELLETTGPALSQHLAKSSFI